MIMGELSSVFYLGFLFAVFLDVQDCCQFVNSSCRWCFRCVYKSLVWLNLCSPATVLLVIARPSCFFHDVSWMMLLSSCSQMFCPLLFLEDVFEALMDSCCAFDVLIVGCSGLQLQLICLFGSHYMFLC